MKEEWLFHGAVVPIDVETTAALVAEIKRLIDVIGGMALAQTEQEPEWYHGIDVYGCNRFYHKTEDRTSEFNTPLYTTPPQRTWVRLTDEEIWKFWWARPEIPEGENDSMEAEFVAAVRAVLAVHGIKEKNNG